MKVSSKIYKGIEYIQLADLPLVQQEKFIQTINDNLFIKIMIDKKIIAQCIQYKDYELWFDSVYQHAVAPVRQELTLEPARREVSYGKA